MQGDFNGALEQFRLEAVPIFALTGQAIALHELGNENEASAALEGLVSQYGDAALYQQAQVAAQWGETESALDLLKRAMAAFDPGMLFLPNDPILDPLRERPQFETLRSALSA